MSKNPTQHETSRRLLETASEVFSEFGYRNATLREICRRAKTNIASVNYHFRDKETLFAEVVNYMLDNVSVRILPVIDAKTDFSPEERLGIFIRTFLFAILGENSSDHLMKLMFHEMDESNPVTNLVADKILLPVERTLHLIVLEILGENEITPFVEDCAASILGQCGSYAHARGIIHHVTTYKEYDEATIEHLAAHVTRFSLAALRGLKAKHPAEASFEQADEEQTAPVA
jgi:AcrR family transcriptional regulator